MPLTIALLNMPFSALRLPSIALTQLKSVVERRHGTRVSVGIEYLNHEFGHRLGPQLYDFIASSNAAHVCGLGEWLFRQVAFPESPDNRATYLSRYRHHLNSSRLGDLEARLEEFRSGLCQFLDELIVRYRLQEADVVGLTSMFSQNLPSIALARRLRRARPDQLIIMGGANCEGTMGIELVTNLPVLDFVFSGHSLVTFPEFIGNVLDGKLDACHRIDGVFSRRNSRSISSSTALPGDIDWSKQKPDAQLDGITSRPRELNINEDIELDYDGFLHSLDTHVPQVAPSAALMFETSRGCWWGERAHCTFCGLNGSTMAYRAMQPQRAVALIEGLLARYGQRVSAFDAVDNILPVEYIDGVIGKLRPADNIKIFYEVKSDLTGDQVRTLANGGVRVIQPGIEALATSTLKIMRKGTTAFHGIRLLTECKTHNVKPMWNLLVGFPGEAASTYERYTQTLPSLFHLPPPQGAFPVRFDRFSPYFNFAREYGLKLAPYDFYGLCYPFPAVSLSNMAYYFQDMNYEAQYLRDAAAWLKPLRTLTNQWNAHWNQANGSPHLQLRAEAAGATVDDTRDGTLRRHALSANELELLRLASVPTRVEDLTPECRGALVEVERKALVFGERGKVVSLVSVQ